MKHPDENPLLKEILADEQLAVLRHALLNQGLEEMRRARRLRRAARVGLLALLPVLLMVALTQHKRIQETTSQPSIPGPQQASVVAAPPQESGVKMISDEELFALFPGRSLALIGKPGHQQLVFLDAPASR
jgi:hypothetical protein